MCGRDPSYHSHRFRRTLVVLSWGLRGVRWGIEMSIPLSGSLPLLKDVSLIQRVFGADIG